MSNRWATIVYGRSYHLDFRFITIPEDFTEHNTKWALQHIVATTQQARNLADNPRWSLFKNNSHCVTGVTCMMRDLIDHLSDDLVEIMTKDDRGRPLYVFVGYVTRLNQDRQVQDFPIYTAENLDSFKVLYQQIERVWLVKNYDRDSRDPIASQYQSLSFGVERDTTITEQPELNDHSQDPDRVFLNSSLFQANSQLWSTSARCSQPTSICLNIKGRPLFNSPFLNQTVTQLDRFEIRNRIVSARKTTSVADPSLPQKISNRAKEDLGITLQQATKVATASQELLNSFTDWSKDDSTNEEPSPQLDEIDSFGFKSKKSSPSEEQDWF